MKCPCPGAASVLLAVLWLLASGTQPPGCQECAMLRSQQGPVLPPARPKRSTVKPSCLPGMSWIHSAGRCCTQCPPGMFLQTPCTSHGNDNICAACSAGTFLSHPNTLRKCNACYTCDNQSFQTVVSNCSATSNVACGCESGYFQECHNKDESCSEFSCKKCKTCPGRLLLQPCSDRQDAQCGSCKPDFYAEGSECRPCHMSSPETCGEECQQVCGHHARGSGLEYILLGLTGPLFLGALAIYHKRKRLQMETPAVSPLPTVPPWDCPSPTACMHPSTQRATTPAVVQCQEWEPSTSTVRRGSESLALLHQQPSRAALPNGTMEPLVPQEPSTAHSPAPLSNSPQRCALLQGSQLYAVINAVPVRRWKEFMRVLELRDTEIELVEMEVALFRDQQYEMLKRWCQQTSATLDRIFAALEHMDLSGCAETLRQSLALGP
ncbi:tumor necrosis factor receptor superfamily member 25 [Numida meleagris]|uniref:tumor necrosis factor receptor superfamily member 25 n=1 Tax=Numida meleagris TaxID=8996 RepID=UPI000B3DD497|nr:tumor necrosis factor receptor superfamily member 25 [Numida meleagris]